MWEDARVLVTVKAYPSVSERRGETVCVAGIRLDGDAPRWIRLYPVSFRDLPKTVQFEKYQVISLRVDKSTDTRPESYKPDLESIELGERLDTSRGWASRWEYLAPFAAETTTCALRAVQESEGPQRSLGLVRPDVQDVEVVPNESFEEDKAQLANIAAQDSLFGEAKEALEPSRYRLKYQYKCADEPSCKGHNQTCIDWEVAAAARRWSRTYPESEIADRLRTKFLNEMCGSGRDPYFFVGNQFMHVQSFLVLGVFWPPRLSRPHEALF